MYKRTIGRLPQRLTNIRQRQSALSPSKLMVLRQFAIIPNDSRCIGKTNGNGQFDINCDGNNNNNNGKTREEGKKKNFTNAREFAPRVFPQTIPIALRQFT